MRETKRPTENIEGPWMHRDRVTMSVRVEAADVAIRPVETHETVYGRDLFERGIDGSMGIRRREAADADANQRSEPGLSAFNGLVA